MEGSFRYLYPNVPPKEQERAAIGFLNISRYVYINPQLHTYVLSHLEKHRADSEGQFQCSETEEEVVRICWELCKHQLEIFHNFHIRSLCIALSDTPSSWSCVCSNKKQENQCEIKNENAWHPSWHQDWRGGSEPQGHFYCQLLWFFENDVQRFSTQIIF